jgi:AcrR family transcriptional regulator
MNTPAAKLEWVRMPRQARSQQTLERLLDAAEAIIAEQGVDNASVAEIARRADSSIGAFYARFHDKEGLLRYLFERFGEQADATALVALEPSRWEGVPLRQALETLLRFMSAVLNDKRGLIAAMFARVATDPSLGLLGDRLLERISSLLTALITSRGARVEHRELDKAVHVVVWTVLSALELRAVYSIHSKPRFSDNDAASELTELCIRYLGLFEPRPERIVHEPSLRRAKRMRTSP